jgi:hypothetical protein
LLTILPFTALEQVDQMMEEVPARQSAKWVPHESFAAKIGAVNQGRDMDELNMKEPGQQHLEEVKGAEVA